ncbi:MAG TPA: hypothetical protein DIC59_10540, partial [Candidatus Competibacteraceae bacterium]|nr:hypothetical protein [Candidatus Competibacteraceae bacterium]
MKRHEANEMTEGTLVSWAAELGGARLGDARLSRRLVQVAERLGAQPGASIPMACGGWAETQGAYRLLAVMPQKFLPSEVKLKRLLWRTGWASSVTVSYTHLRAHETVLALECRLLLEQKQHKLNE